jgi:hypothetical protein
MWEKYEYSQNDSESMSSVFTNKCKRLDKIVITRLGARGCKPNAICVTV